MRFVKIKYGYLSENIHHPNASPLNTNKNSINRNMQNQQLNNSAIRNTLNDQNNHRTHEFDSEINLFAISGCYNTSHHRTLQNKTIKPQIYSLEEIELPQLLKIYFCLEKILDNIVFFILYTFLSSFFQCLFALTVYVMSLQSDSRAEQMHIAIMFISLFFFAFDLIYMEYFYHKYRKFFYFTTILQLF